MTNGAGIVSEVSLSVPATTRHVALCRMAAASLAVELDFEADEVDDLRMGVNELVALLVDTVEPGEGRLDLAFALGDGSIELRAVLQTERAVGVEPDAIARSVLDAVVDRWSIDSTGGSLAKHRRV